MRTIIALLLALASLTVAAAPRAVDVRAFGAKCDGKTDDAAAIQRALDAMATVRGIVRVPADRTCAYGKTLNVHSAQLVGYGPTSVLTALRADNAAVFMRGSAPQVRSLRLGVSFTPTERVSNWEYKRIVPIDGARNFVIDSVVTDGGAGATITVDLASGPGRITRNWIRGGLADAIHTTGSSHDIRIEHNLIEGQGDDGIAVVSPVSNGGPSRRVVARYNTIRNQTWGRGMSTVGSRDVLYEFNTIENVGGGGACMIVAQESSFSTYGNQRVVMRENTMRNCPQNSSKGHPAILVTSSGDYPNQRIVLARNLIVLDGPEQADVYGLRLDDPALNDVQAVGNLIAGAKQYNASGHTVVPYVTQLPVGDPGNP